MHWPGIEPGNSKDFALSERLDRRFQRLLQVVGFDWADFDLARFPIAQYREDRRDVLVSVLDRGGKEDPDLYAVVEVSPEEEDTETYLLVQFKSDRRMTAKALVQEIARRRLLRLQGSRTAKPEAWEWLVRALPLSQIEGLQAEQQLIRVAEFLKETAAAVEQSGLLDLDMPRKKPVKEEDREA